MIAIARAGLNLVRKWRRTLLLFLIMFLISILLFASLMICLAAYREKQMLEKELMTTFSLEKDAYNKDLYDLDAAVPGMYSGFYSGPELTQELYEAVRNMDGVTGSNWEKWGGFSPEALDFDLFPGYEVMELETGKIRETEMPLSFLQAALVQTRASVNTDTALNYYFTSGRFELVQGRHITPEDAYVVLMSEDLAQLNDLQIGDRISIGLTAFGAYGAQTADYEEEFAHRTEQIVLGPYSLEIIGLFKREVQPTDQSSATGNIPENLLYIDAKTGAAFETWQREKLAESGLSQVEVDAYMDKYYQQMNFSVSDPGQIEKVRAELYRQMPETKLLSFVTNEKMMQASSMPLRWMMKLTLLMVILTVVTGLVILSLVLLLWARGRKKETGVLLAYGIRKRSILLQFLAEALTIAVLAACLAVWPAARLGSQAGDYLVDKGITRSEEERDEILAGETRIQTDFNTRRMFTQLRDYTPHTLAIEMTPEIVAIGAGMLVAGTVVSVLIANVGFLGSRPKKLIQ
ncbi:MAG: ABC transporter permease [Clostridia bacterium]|nr:ABC transporter permease [Clostridia bacterium]